MTGEHPTPGELEWWARIDDARNEIEEATAHRDAQILMAVEDGVTVTFIADQFDVSRGTVYRWMAAGEKLREQVSGNG